MLGAIFDIKKFALHDGPGIRTTVFFKGCPLNCWWCHNPESIREVDSQEELESACFNTNGVPVSIYNARQLFEKIKKDILFYEESDGGVTFSGGEPLMQPDFLAQILHYCRHEDIHTTVDTSGYAPYFSYEKILPYTSLFLFDIKMIDDDDHMHYTNVSNRLIHLNLKRILENGADVIIRIPLITGITDTEKNINETIEFLTKMNGIRRIDLLPYNEFADSKYKRYEIDPKIEGLKTQPDDKLADIKDKFVKAGFDVTLRG